MRKPAQIHLKERAGIGRAWHPRLVYGVMQLADAVAALRSISAYTTEAALFYRGRRISARVWLTQEWANRFGVDAYGIPTGPEVRS